MTKKLYRSSKDYVIGGVCGGIAEYFEVDPVAVRLVVAVLTVFGGLSLLVYILGWIIIPEE